MFIQVYSSANKLEGSRFRHVVEKKTLNNHLNYWGKPQVVQITLRYIKSWIVLFFFRQFNLEYNSSGKIYQYIKNNKLESNF